MTAESLKALKQLKLIRNLKFRKGTDIDSSLTMNTEMS